ncbi:virB8 family protein [Luteibacter yeojuensis]|uniref:virB8 family protein n=1 Tax=Luteibacter yeojuensis TaxID=345309 RepID=UPI000A02CDD5|nr:type IV secretion system protein [Luteibacter yeojuensis]
MLRKKNSPKIDEAVQQGVNFEVTLSDNARRAEKRAWTVAICSCIVSVILAGGYFYMLPLKEKVPFIVLADPYSGTASVARLTDDLVNRQITSSEAVNRSNIAHFIIARESYDLAISNLRDWPTVLTMSSPDVAQPYLDLHADGNPQAPFKVYGKAHAIRIKILSIVLNGVPGQTPTGATVRFQRSVYDKNNGSSYLLDSKIATMAFSYKPNLRMDDQNRIENPLGFQVSSYRVDNDYGNAPPPEVPVTAPAGAAGQPAPVGAAQAADAPGPTAAGQPAYGAPGAVPPAQPQTQPGVSQYPPPGAGAAPIPLAPANGIPPSTIPTEATYPAQPPAAGAGAARQPAAAAASPANRSAANGGRR